jgi:acyl-CoA synthetase (NDP forming)
MRPVEVLVKAKIQGKTTLNEAESKQLLAFYGVPVVEESIASTLEEAVESAREIGFPIVLKGFGAGLTHKTEHGLVRMGLNNAEEIRHAVIQMAENVEGDLEGWVLQPQLKGRREFVAGMFRNDEFGPVIMFGLGGVFTEALNDVVFRIAPLDANQAGEMLDEIAARNLLKAFRGEPEVDRERLIKIILGLSRLSKEQPTVAEVDINPLLITLEGQPIAVDALVALEKAKPKASVRPPVDPFVVSALFHPKSIAFVGATSRFRKWGQLLFTGVVAGGYNGDIYLVNPNGKSIAGRPVYKSVVDIPGPVDLAVVSVPASKVFSLLSELSAKRVKGVILITSGFGEVGLEGRKLEDSLVAEARKKRLVILGPNTMGLCNPHEKFYCMGAHFRPKPGDTAFVSQSGNLGIQLMAFAERQGIGIRAFAGSGNEAMLTIEDALEYFERDPLTNTILLYIESVKNGRRFFESARRVSRKKPIVVIKGGRTRAGERAAASHTGALASNTRVFEAVCRQAGIVSVKQPMDLLDLSAVFSSLPLPGGRRVAIMTLGGGWGVITADLCNEYGLEVPELSPEIIHRLDRYLPPFWSRSNPLDLVGESDPSLPLKVVNELLKWDGCDAVISLGMIGRSVFLDRLIHSTVLTDPETDLDYLNSVKQNLVKFDVAYTNRIVRLMEEYDKPVVGVSMDTNENNQSVLDGQKGRYKGVFFQTPERAVKALAKMCEYKYWLNREKKTKMIEPEKP